MTRRLWMLCLTVALTALSAAPADAGKIDLDFRDAPLAQVAELLRTGHHLALTVEPGLGDRRVTLQVNGATVPEALTLLAESAGAKLAMQPRGDVVEYRIQRGTAAAMPARRTDGRVSFHLTGASLNRLAQEFEAQTARPLVIDARLQPDRRVVTLNIDDVMPEALVPMLRQATGFDVLPLPRGGLLLYQNAPGALPEVPAQPGAGAAAPVAAGVAETRFVMISTEELAKVPWRWQRMQVGDGVLRTAVAAMQPYVTDVVRNNKGKVINLPRSRPLTAEPQALWEPARLAGHGSFFAGAKLGWQFPGLTWSAELGPKGTPQLHGRSENGDDNYTIGLPTGGDLSAVVDMGTITFADGQTSALLMAVTFMPAK